MVGRGRERAIPRSLSTIAGHATTLTLTNAPQEMKTSSWHCKVRDATGADNGLPWSVPSPFLHDASSPSCTMVHSDEALIILQCHWLIYNSLSNHIQLLFNCLLVARECVPRVREGHAKKERLYSFHLER